MTNFIYRGFYYPVFGSSVGWSNGKYISVLDRRVGGYGENNGKWWTFSWGRQCKVFNKNNPYILTIGGTLTVGPDPTSGTYTGDIIVEVIYP